jgi:demethylmenaquinone methyltransferase/2-methoxy-6-polyprenyl-1,4-benzoquinol methylase
MTQETVKPFKESSAGKKEQVAAMFDGISHRYDFLNHFLSMGIDRGWRRRAVKMLRSIQPRQMLDIATGTGDFAIACLKLNPERVTGVDISNGMLEKGRQKLVKRKLDDRIVLEYGDSEHLQFNDGTFDAITVGFGVRNFEDLEAGLREMHRVLRPGGRAAILEFSKPRKFPVKQLFGFYSKVFIPFWGKMVARSRSAYTYLPESVQAFPDGKAFEDVLVKCGFTPIETRRVSGGIASIYLAEKQ